MANNTENKNKRKSVHKQQVQINDLKNRKKEERPNLIKIDTHQISMFKKL